MAAPERPPASEFAPAPAPPPRRSRAGLLAIALLVLSANASRPAHAESTAEPPRSAESSAPASATPQPPPRFAWPRPTWVWTLTQLVPSPALRLGGAEVEPALRWQLTPLAYAFGLDPRVPRWRAWVVEPLARHAGSLELAVQPELAPGSAEPWAARVWARVYLPLAERGEALSMSLGMGYQRTHTQDAPAVQLGLHALFGVLGLEVSHALAPAHAGRTTVALSLRYF